MNLRVFFHKICNLTPPPPPCNYAQKSNSNNSNSNNKNNKSNSTTSNHRNETKKVTSILGDSKIEDVKAYLMTSNAW